MVFYFYFFLLDVTSTSASKSTNGSQRSFQQLSNYQIPASALYEATEDLSASGMSASAGRMGTFIYNVFLLLYNVELSYFST